MAGWRCSSRRTARLCGAGTGKCTASLPRGMSRFGDRPAISVAVLEVHRLSDTDASAPGGLGDRVNGFIEAIDSEVPGPAGVLSEIEVVHLVLYQMGHAPGFWRLLRAPGSPPRAGALPGEPAWGRARGDGSELVCRGSGYGGRGRCPDCSAQSRTARRQDRLLAGFQGLSRRSSRGGDRRHSGGAGHRVDSSCHGRQRRWRFPHRMPVPRARLSRHTTPIGPRTGHRRITRDYKN